MNRAPTPEWGPFAGEASLSDLGDAPFASTIENFYQTDPISRASETMAACTEEILSRAQAGRDAAHG